jgi:Mn-dependent DtxR family transcriptional regulator
MDGDGHITLLPDGEAIANKVYERHELLTRFFVRLGVSEETAATDACKVEHVLSQETFDCIKNQLK